MLGIYIGDLDASGGTQKYATILANYLSRCNIEVEVLTNKDVAAFYTMDNCISVKVADLSGLIGYKGELIVLDIKSLRVLWLRFLLGKSLIVWQHTAFYGGFKFQRLLGRVTRLLKIVCITDYQKKYFNRNDYCSTIRNPYLSLGIDNNGMKDIDFLSIGSLFSVKGFDLIEYLASYDDLNSLNFVVVGLNRNHPNVHYLERTRKPADYYNRSRVYLLLSRSEVWPTVFFEAIEAGLIVVVNKELEFVSELEIEMLERVVLVSIDDIDDMVSGVKLALDLAKTMSRPDMSSFINVEEWEKWKKIIE